MKGNSGQVQRDWSVCIGYEGETESSTAAKEVWFVTLVTLSHTKMMCSQNYYSSAYKCWPKGRSVLEFWSAVISFSACLGGESILEEHISLEGGCLFPHF